jgi:nucleotide-binding universal stress UspA family protein
MSAYAKILVAIDGSGASARGLAEAMKLAKSEGAELCIVHVVNEIQVHAPPVGAPPVDLGPVLLDQGKRLLEDAVAQAAREGLKAKPILVDRPAGRSAEAIVAEAARQGADLIVLGTHGRRGVSRLVLGSDAEQVVRSAAVPVLLVKAGAAH